MIDIAANYRKLLDSIGAAAAKTGRDASRIRLLAASKAQSVEAIRAAVTAGVGLIGENYVQEAQRKKALINEPAEWHMIGHLQRNKARAALEIFDVVESLDNIELARELDREGRKRGRTVRVFLEVKLGGEERKSGVVPENLLPLLEESAGLSYLRVEGLMTVPPFCEDPESVRPYFRRLSELQQKLSELRLPNIALTELSMGMTHDYAIAVEEGATIVRIGTALFGPRRR